MRRDTPEVDLRSAPELAQLAEAVQASGKARISTRDGAAVAAIAPAPDPIGPRPRRSRALAKEVPLLRLIGVGHSGMSGGPSERKHEQRARSAPLLPPVDAAAPSSILAVRSARGGEASRLRR